MQFSTINSDVCKAIGDLSSARLDEVKAVVNMVYLDELLNADHDRPMYFLRRFDDSIKTKNSDAIVSITKASPARGAGVNVGLVHLDPPDIGAEPYLQYVPWRH
jgi:hypothetical protein